MLQLSHVKLTARTCRAAFSEAAGGQDSVDDGVESRTGPHRLADGVGGVHGEENHIILLVVSIPLKNMSHWEGLSHILWEIKNV